MFPTPPTVGSQLPFRSADTTVRQYGRTSSLSTYPRRWPFWRVTTCLSSSIYCVEFDSACLTPQRTCRRWNMDTCLLTTRLFSSDGAWRRGFDGTGRRCCTTSAVPGCGAAGAGCCVGGRARGCRRARGSTGCCTAATIACRICRGALLLLKVQVRASRAALPPCRHPGSRQDGIGARPPSMQGSVLSRCPTLQSVLASAAGKPRCVRQRCRGFTAAKSQKGVSRRASGFRRTSEPVAYWDFSRGGRKAAKCDDTPAGIWCRSWRKVDADRQRRALATCLQVCQTNFATRQ